MTENKNITIKERTRLASEAVHQLEWPKSSDESWRRTPVYNFPLDDIFSNILENGNNWQGERPDLDQIKQSINQEFSEAENTEELAKCCQIIFWNNEFFLTEKLPEGVQIFQLDESTDSKMDMSLENIIPYNKNRFTALHYAHSTKPVIIHIQKNIAVEKTIQINHVFTESQKLSLPQIMIISDEGSNVSIVEKYFSQASDKSQQDASTDKNYKGLISFTEIYAADNSSVNYYGIENLDPSTLGFFHIGGNVAKDARVDLGIAQLGARMTKWYVDLSLVEPGGYSHIHGFSFGSGNRHLDLEAVQTHIAPHTTSELNYKSAVTQRSYSVFSGLLLIQKEAKGAVANQVNKNIVIGPKAKAHSTPKLEILEDEVQCSHGATVSDIDPESVFYLKSRGINERDAQRLIIEGFFEDVIHKTPITPIHKNLSYLMIKGLNEAGL